MRDRITPAEEEAFNCIMNFIEDYGALEMETYSATIEHNASVNGLQYYNLDQIDMYCVKLNHSGNPLNICLKSIGYENMEVNIYPKNDDGSRVINFMYCYDESDGTEEWYEKKPYWYADFSLLMYETEEEYFQASTVDDLVLTIEENQMFINFYNEFMDNLKTTMGRRNG